jgi:hypothetical protein
VHLRKLEQDVDRLLLGQPLLADRRRERRLDESSLFVVDGLPRRSRRNRGRGKRQRRGDSSESD